MPPRPAATDLLECFEIARCVRPPIADAFLTKFGVESRKKTRFLVVHQTARCNSTLRRKGLHSFSVVRAAHARVAAVKVSAAASRSKRPDGSTVDTVVDSAGSK